ncbi:PBSX family phage terminase large subunit [Pontibacillus litoralis]|uniref:Terminase n=1 Tax=Pontibacillus litoralis JSM 072002 TaxID=1385512 RepID=A0A0A5HWN6_9BACI|nr:PBSX family phage terminase large subunit [Pontibacillus litoralis]KGX88012.1 terminase [Pontibacillus litoralis JSM 072002]
MIEKEVNPHFEDFLFDWEQKFQFLVGGYGSSKSYHVALKIILKLLEEKRTALVVREVYETIRESCFALFEELIIDLELENSIKAVTSPMQIRFPNGSKIIFKGMDKPQKLKSIHNVSLIWLEECSEIKYEGFKELIGRLRHPVLKLHMILSTNPVDEGNWTYSHFFIKNKAQEDEVVFLDDEKLYEKRTVVVGDTYYHHSTADDNLFLPESYIQELEKTKVYDLDFYRVARKGRFGVSGTKVLPQFESKPHDEVMAEIKAIYRPMYRAGMDFGFEESYNALLRMAIDDKNKVLYIYWEYYSKKKDDPEIADDLQEFAATKEKVKGDSAEPKTIYYLRKRGLNITGAYKPKGSRLQNTKKVKRFHRIVCSDKCPNTIRELKNLTYKKDKQGNTIYDEFNIDPHTFSAVWYGLDDYEVVDLKDKKEKVKAIKELGL